MPAEALPPDYNRPLRASKGNPHLDGERPLRIFLARRWFLLVLLAGVAFTLTVPDPVAHGTAGLEPRWIVTLALFLMSYTMPTTSLVGELAWPWPAAWAIVISYGFVPAGALLLGLLSPLPDLRIGLLLSASVPCTLASAVLWTRLAGGNEATALLTTLGTTFLSFVATTLWLSLATGTSVPLEPGPMMLDLIWTLIVPVAVGQGLRIVPTLRQAANRHRALLGIVAQFLVLSIAIKTSASVGLQIRAGSTQITPVTILACATLGMTLHLGALLVGLWTSRWLRFDRPRQIAVAFSASQKTLPVSLFLFENYYKAAFPLAVVPLLFFHVGQLILDTFIADRLRGRGSPSPP